jgi:hypothetical protein
MQGLFQNAKICANDIQAYAAIREFGRNSSFGMKSLEVVWVSVDGRLFFYQIEGSLQFHFQFRAFRQVQFVSAAGLR